MVKVLFISPTVAEYIGGTETVVSRLSHQLKSKVALTVLSGASGMARQNLMQTDSFELITLPFLGRDSRWNRLLSKLLMSSPFKIESYSFFKALSRNGFELSSYDWILTFYEADAYLLSKRYPSIRDRCRHFLPGVSIRGFFKHVPAQAVFFFGYRGAEKAKRKWGVTIPSLPLGVDSGFFPCRSRAYPKQKRLVYIGRLDGSKHVDWLAELFAKNLAQKGYHLDIVGDGPLLQELTAKYGGLSCMTLHGKKRQEEVISVLQDAFLLLHPTHHESFGLTILEALASGVPVITHPLDSIKIWAQDFPRYAPYLDSSAWVDEILKFDDSVYWERLSAGGIEHARSFSWDRVAEQVLAFIGKKPER